MPEEKPLQGITALELVLEAEFIIWVIKFEQIEQFSAGLHDGVWR